LQGVVELERSPDTAKETLLAFTLEAKTSLQKRRERADVVRVRELECLAVTGAKSHQ
jgi:hypothetical protein